VFRISVVLKSRINIRSLYMAVEAIENRFPYYKVKLKKGFFWYYLDYENIPFTVEADLRQLCRSFRSGGTTLLLRILVNKNILSVEFSHILADGHGAFEFFKTLLLTYFEKCGITISPDINYLRPGMTVKKEEYEDSYRRQFLKDLPTVLKYPSAFHVPFPLKKKPRFDVLSMVIPLNEILNKVREYKVSLTVYLVSVYLAVLQDIYQNMQKFNKRKADNILRIQVPIDLRTLYPSSTMRNFSLFVMPEIDLRLGSYTFEEIIKTVYHLMNLETDPKLINKIISRNVGSEKKLLLRSTPIFIKSLVLQFVYYSLGSKLFSGVITNMGKVNFSDEINALIDHFVIVAPPPNKVLKINCGLISFKEKLVMTFRNITESKELENKFIDFLKTQGIHPEIIKIN